MTYNNTVTLIGHLGAEAEEKQSEQSKFYVFRMATAESYKDEEGEWQNTATEWHEVLAFDPLVISSVKSLKAGARIRMTGKLSYRDVPIVWKGKETTKKEMSIIAKKVELAPLPANTSKDESIEVEQFDGS